MSAGCTMEYKDRENVPFARLVSPAWSPLRYTWRSVTMFPGKNLGCVIPVQSAWKGSPGRQVYIGTLNWSTSPTSRPVRTVALPSLPRRLNGWHIWSDAIPLKWYKFRNFTISRDKLHIIFVFIQSSELECICIVCIATCRNNLLRIEHYLRLHPEKVYPCLTCGRRFTSPETLKKHGCGPQKARNGVAI